jgi:hypothetical protein
VTDESIEFSEVRGYPDDRVTGLFRSRPNADAHLGLAVRYSAATWVAVFGLLIAVVGVLFGYVHNYVDMRVCIGYSPDPLFRFIPLDMRWTIVTIYLYVVMIFVGAIAILTQAAKGMHAPTLRWALAISIMSTLRMLTLWLIPLCRPTIQAGAAPPLSSPATLDLHFFSIPWRVFALNDVVYSGHTSLFLMLVFATATWPPAARFIFAIFTVTMAYSLLATRDHYTVDIILALPCAYFADGMSVAILRWVAQRRRSRAPAYS